MPTGRGDGGGGICGVNVEVTVIRSDKNPLKRWTTFIEQYPGQWRRMAWLRRRVNGLSDNEAAGMLDRLDCGPAGAVVAAQEQKCEERPK